jgi:hypothetical protein
MESQDYLEELDRRIKLIERAATELVAIGREKEIPAVYKNARRIIATVNILKIEVSDILDLKV